MLKILRQGDYPRFLGRANAVTTTNKEIVIRRNGGSE
jgi:hypothetical protein